MTSVHPTRTLPTLLRGVIAIGLTAFTGCAPMMSSPPSTPVRDAAFGEINHGIHAGVRNEGGLNPEAKEGGIQGMGNYHLSIRKPLNDENTKEFGTLVQAGWPGVLSVGGYYRRRLIGGDKTYIGAQGSIGWLWVGGAVPMAFKLNDTMWLTTQPAISVGAYAVQLTRVPLGLSWELGEYNRFDAEVGGTIEGKSDKDGLGENYQGYVGVHFSRQLVPKKLRQQSAE